MRAEFIWLRKEFCGYQPPEQSVAWSLLARVKFLAPKTIVPQINLYWSTWQSMCSCYSHIYMYTSHALSPFEIFLPNSASIYCSKQSIPWPTHIFVCMFPKSCKVSYPLPVHRQKFRLFSCSLVFTSHITPHVPVSGQTMRGVSGQRIPPLVFIHIVIVGVSHRVDTWAAGL